MKSEPTGNVFVQQPVQANIKEITKPGDRWIPLQMAINAECVSYYDVIMELLDNCHTIHYEYHLLHMDTDRRLNPWWCAEDKF